MTGAVWFYRTYATKASGAFVTLPPYRDDNVFRRRRGIGAPPQLTVDVEDPRRLTDTQRVAPIFDQIRTIHCRSPPFAVPETSARAFNFARIGPKGPYLCCSRLKPSTYGPYGVSTGF
jgi:hypothetical protein